MILISGSTALLEELKKFDKFEAVSRIAGLLTFPEFAANTFRLEFLVHLACAVCSGHSIPDRNTIGKWLNDDLGKSSQKLSDPSPADMEDPVEDVFISNVISGVGNSLIFEGLWESNDFYLQQILDGVFRGAPLPNSGNLKKAVFSLLKVSNLLGERCSLNRWENGCGVPKLKMNLPNEQIIIDRAKRVVFSASQLLEIKINPDWLSPFILAKDQYQVILEEISGDSSLERRPILQFKDQYILAIPSACSPAIRHYILRWLSANNQLECFSQILRLEQGNKVFNDYLMPLKTSPVEVSNLPEKPSNGIRLDSVVVKFDNDKLCHLVLLHDGLAEISDNGLTSTSVGNNSLSKEFGQYLSETAKILKCGNHCKSGLTIIILGGLGRGRFLEFNAMPSDWYVGCFSMADFFYLVHSEEISLLKIWKFYFQLDYLRIKGIKVNRKSGDLNLYSFWKDNAYSFVPNQVAYPEENFISASSEYALKIREDSRKCFDFHAISIGFSSRFLPVMKNYPNAHFKNLKDAPIYISPSSLKKGKLYGVVETQRGPWWLKFNEESQNREINDVLYRVWDGLLQWMSKLCPQLDSHLKNLKNQPITFEVSINDIEKWPKLIRNGRPKFWIRPKVSAEIKKNTIHISMHIEFFLIFFEAENIGEKILIETLIEGVSNLINQFGNSKIDESTKKNLLNNTVIDSGAKTVHFLYTSSPKAHLEFIAREKPCRFIAEEDRSFSNLGLAWRGVNSDEIKTLNEKRLANKFLNKLVDGLWEEILVLLKDCNRRYLIKMIVENLEGIYGDQYYWNFTAQATNIPTLYLTHF